MMPLAVETDDHRDVDGIGNRERRRVPAGMQSDEDLLEAVERKRLGAPLDVHSSAAANQNGLLRRPPRRHLMSDADLHLDHLSGSVTAPLAEPGGAFFSLSTRPCPRRPRRPRCTGCSGWSRIEHDEELRVRRIRATGARHADDASCKRHLGKLPPSGSDISSRRSVEILSVAGLRHEPLHDAVERHVVVITLTRQPA